MKSLFTKTLLVAVFLGMVAVAAEQLHAEDPLPSWNDTAAKKAILKFVELATTPGSPDFVPVAERIATFDNLSLIHI